MDRENKRKSSKKKIDNIIFFGHKPVNKIYPYLKNADILLVTLKDGKVFDATIPGKFSIQKILSFLIVF